MAVPEQKIAAKAFAERWKDRGSEKSDSQTFWISLLRDVYGVEHPENFIEFEDEVHLDNTSFIDGYIPSTRVMIEQKSIEKSLNTPIKQSDGTLLTPFQQAKRYCMELPVSQHPLYVITCNFKEFWVYDMNKPQGEPEKIKLADLENEYYRLQFLVDSHSEHLERELEVSVAAGEIVGKLYDAFHAQYADPDSVQSLHSLNVLCVRLVFCLYAENGGIFGHYAMFHDYLANFSSQQMRKALLELFQILDTPEDKRDKYLKDDNPELAAFPYVNGGLFSDENIEIPPFTDKIKDLLLEQASAGFNWADISPTIFGAVFESTLNPETRRTDGMHYTSVENIHKVIDPLFLDDLKAEFDEICQVDVERTRKKKLEDFQKKLASLTFLDPACGSGNFLTETYLSLRRLENDVLRELKHGQISMGDAGLSPIQVSLDQFYGIEINDFAVTVAKTALWIAEAQMMQETESIVMVHLDFLPLKSYTNIVEGNALRMDWNEVVPSYKVNYIMGNPPFVGGMMMTREQKDDITNAVGKEVRGVGEMDYVAAWYYQATLFIENTSIRVAFVSTNSICQGQQAVTLWKPLFKKGIHIDFAHLTFRWDSEASLKAHVHCIIVGFSSAENKKNRVIYTDKGSQIVENINCYLVDADNVFVESRSDPMCNVPKMRFGNMPRDGGNFILTDDEREKIIKKEPLAEKWLHKYVGAEEFINNKSRWCLWLVDADPHEIKQCPTVMNRVEAVKEFRLNSKAAATRKFAETPTLFCQIAQPNSEYLIVPGVSSERRKYIPVGFMQPSVIASNLVQIIPNATIYHFGVLTSNVHMAWMRAVCGRLEMRYRYSKDIVYNNFPWPDPTPDQKAKIERTAQGILDARALYPDSSLADLYDELTMPPELRKAHQENDRVVMQAYGFSIKETTESSCVAKLMKMYQNLVDKIKSK